MKSMLPLVVAQFLTLICTSNASSAVVVYYEFNDGPVFNPAILLADSGPNNITGTAGSSGSGQNPAFRNSFGNLGLALRFFGNAGGASYVEVVDSGASPLDLTGPLTIEAFLYPTQIQQQVIVRKFGGLGGLSGGPGGYYLDMMPSGQVSFCLFDDNFRVVSNRVLQARRKYHVAGTWDGTNMMIYVNYRLEGIIPYSGVLMSNNSRFGIGAILRDNGTVGQAFNGFIDSVRISDQALGPNEFLRPWGE